ncbi:hypothetical protein [Psychroserpens ponticola]|uniref:Tetratricopeptide repeat protein n=1 Tax=Psychroserpens ponticola TaxID=2932268 RepID=A0ABY7S217_9FLAO|nr:hypothetical protein [Psychroserpens ponticola]WCO03318.1 hypothetical protein MUN68_007400 [Psychroserpens ponticola]
MGYMGFGMMSWTYKQRARKPFSKRKGKPVYSTLTKYSSSLVEVVIVCVFLVAFYVMIPRIADKGNDRRQQEQSTREYQDHRAFKFLMNSGKQRLKRNRVEEAYSDLKLAHDIKPNDEKINQLLIETLSILCVNDNNYCKALDRMLNCSL